MDKSRSSIAAKLFSGGVTPIRLRDGRTAAIRLAQPDDAGELSAMHVRCSRESVYQRYHSSPAMTGRFLSRLLSTDITLVTVSPNRSVIAIANIGQDDDGTGELAVLVEDSWQGVGLGTALLRQLVTMARLTGYREVYASCLTGSGWGRHALGKLGPLRVEQVSDRVQLRLGFHEPTLIDLRNVPDLVPSQ